MYKLSIAIPVFNRVSLILESVESVLKVVSSDVQLIVVDNCSSDGTWEVLQRKLANIPNAYLYRNDKNIGPVRNWERCIQLATGEYFKLLFSDDLLLTTDFDGVLRALDEDKDTGFAFSPVLTGQKVEESRVAFDLNSAGGFLSAEHVRKFFFLRPGYLVSPAAAIFRTEFVKQKFRPELPGADQKAYGFYGAGPDLMLFLTALYGFRKVHYTPVPMVFFRDHDESATTSALQTGAWPIRESYNYTRLFAAIENKSLFITGRVLARYILVHAYERRSFKRLRASELLKKLSVVDIVLVYIVAILSLPDSVARFFWYYSLAYRGRSND